MKIIYLTHVIYEDEDMYTAICPELDIASCGESIEEADKSLTEAIGLYLNSCEELGWLENIFRERNITVYIKEIKPQLVWEKVCRELIDKLDFEKEPYIKTTPFYLESIKHNDSRAILT
jgi:predicted RNase H-like HicB family nuclease